jgi:hypothetical protein
VVEKKSAQTLQSQIGPDLRPLTASSRIILEKTSPQYKGKKEQNNQTKAFLIHQHPEHFLPKDVVTFF